jgi:hypothetical protein
VEDLGENLGLGHTAVNFIAKRGVDCLHTEQVDILGSLTFAVLVSII